MKHRGRNYSRIVLTLAMAIMLIVVAVALAPALALFPFVPALVVASHRVHRPEGLARFSDSFLLPYAPRSPPQA